MLLRSIILFIISPLFVLIVTGGAVLADQEPNAKIQGILINSNEMFRDSEKELLELSGSVQIIYEGQHIKADRAKIYLRKRQAELFGNVEVVGTKSSIYGDQVFLDYENNTGIIYNGSVQSGSVLFTGDLLQKIGDSEYLVTTADYTACTNCPATWSFNGTTVRAELGGYAYIKNAVLRVGGVPVFWLPYLVVPLKSDRQSGLLTPAFEVSDTGGFAVSMPYFWAISRSTDATVTLKNYERRGLKGLLEYRYVLNPQSSGIFTTAALYDKAFGEDSRLNAYRPAAEQGKPLNRWFIKYDHIQTLPEEYTSKAQVNLASDLQYPKDFPFETGNYGDSAMENRFSVTKNTKDTHTSIDASYYVNMLQSDPLAGNDDAVHRAPELRYAWSQRNLGNTNLIFAMNLDFSNFARSGNSYDDMVYETLPDGSRIRYVKNSCNKADWSDDPTCYRTYDGSFDPTTDLIRTGQRFDFRPSLYYPIRISDGIEVLPKVNYRETLYNLEGSTEPNYVRRYLRTEVSGRMRLSRIYGDIINSKATRYKHEVIPEIGYTAIPWISQKDHPFFGQGPVNDAPYSSRDNINDKDTGSPFGLQFDYNDRIYDRNLVVFALTNKIVEKKWVGDRPEYQQVALLKIAQSYDAAQAERNVADKEPWSDLLATLDIRLNNFQTYSIFDYFPYQNVTNASSRVRLMNDAGQFFQVALTRQYKITPGQPVNEKDRTEDYTFSAGFVSRYINLMGRFVYDSNWAQSAEDEKIKSWAYIAQFKPPGECWLITLIHDQITGGDTNLKLNFEFMFDGNPKPPLPPEALDQFGF